LYENTNYKLTVTDDKGCSAAATAVIKIFTALYMPNAFTPDDDGVNDLFRIPPNTTLTLKEFSVYDRWGNRIFTTKNKKNGWDGTFNGKKQNAGVYIYYIKSVINNKEVFLKGVCVLVR
jgi:gliding motility-associated-like protein